MNKLHSISKEQRLYVMDSGAGYTSYGFEVLGRKAKAIAEWRGAPSPFNFGTLGTKEHFENCMAEFKYGAEFAKHTGAKCLAELTPQLMAYEGKRVEVVDCYGEKRRFYVSRSTGWMPCHIEISRINSSGGPAVSGAPFKSVRGIPNKSGARNSQNSWTNVR